MTSDTNKISETIKKAKLFSQKGSHAKAIELYNTLLIEQSVSDKKQLIEIYFCRGKIYYNLNEFVNAVRDFKRVIELNPEEPSYWLNCSLGYYALDDYLEALNYCNEAIALHQNHPEAHFHRGNIFLQLKRFTEALIDFDTAIFIVSDQPQVYCNRAVAKMKLGDYEGALRDIDSALRLKPNFAEAYRNRGHIHFNRSEYHDAVEFFLMAKTFLPDNSELDALIDHAVRLIPTQPNNR